MAWSKRYLASAALEEIGVASFQYDVTPAELVSVIRRLDSMMAQWDGMGIRIGYALPSGESGSDPDDDSGLPDTALEAVTLNLAVRIAPSYGKALSMDTRMVAHRAYQALLTLNKADIEKANPTSLPTGAGIKSRYLERFFPPAPADITIGNDDVLEI